MILVLESPLFFWGIFGHKGSYRGRWVLQAVWVPGEMEVIVVEVNDASALQKIYDLFISCFSHVESLSTQCLYAFTVGYVLI